MNIKLSQLLILILLLTGTVMTAQDYRTLTTEGKLRKGRNIISGVVATVPAGSSVEVIYNSYDKGYYRVFYDIWTGYLHERHFETVKATHTTPYTNMNNVVFREDFNNNSNEWRESREAQKEFFFRNGAYHIIQRDNGRLTWFAMPVELDTKDDFLIETEVVLHLREGGGAHLMYGVDETGHNYYSVQVKKEKDKKEVFIGKYENKQWNGVWKDATITFNRPIRIQVLKKGQLISYYVNGQFIYSQSFEAFFGEMIALGCEGVQHVSYEFLNIERGSVSVSQADVVKNENEVPVYNPVSQVKLSRKNGVFNIPVELNEALRVYSLFEEGASDITVSPDVAQTLIKSGTIKDMDWLSGGAFDFADGTTAPSERFRLKSVKIGSKVAYNIPCRISGYMQVPMILGKNVLTRMGNYSFDEKNGVLTIQ
jgi:uncharacterized protein YgiM (DUF1202 family)